MFRKDRSDEPIYWGLFGAGGMVIGIVMPIVILAFIVAGFNDAVLANIAHIALHPLTGIVFIGCLILCVWHCLHRIYHSLHDFTIHTNIVIHLAIYGIAALLSLAFIVCYALNEYHLYALSSGFGRLFH